MHPSSLRPIDDASKWNDSCLLESINHPSIIHGYYTQYTTVGGVVQLRALTQPLYHRRSMYLLHLKVRRRENAPTRRLLDDNNIRFLVGIAQ